MGRTTETPEFEFAPVTGKDTSPSHTDMKGDDRDIDLFGQKDGHAVFESGHGTVPCNISFREYTHQFAVTEELS